MAFSLGKGLGSLIPEKETPPPEEHPLDVLHHQDTMHEPVYRFHDQGHAASGKRIEFEPPVSHIRATAAFAPSRVAFAPEARPRKTESVFWIEVSKIKPNPFQPRESFNVDDLTSLAASIRPALMRSNIRTERGFAAV